MTVFNGTNNGETIIAGSGNDTINANGGHDLVVGGLGNDVANLGSGNDRFVWEPGDGDDKVNGGDHTDTLEFNGSDGAEVMTVTTKGAGGTHQFFRDLGDIQVDSKSVERIETDARGGDDRYDASAQTDANVRLSVHGGAGNDIVIGGAGSDSLSGDAGNDRVEGGGGNDWLSGNSGNDLFDYDSTSVGRDVIADFAKGQDKLDLDGIDANTHLAGNQDFVWIGSASFSGAGQVRAVHVSGGTLVQASTDNDHTAELQILLDHQVSLAAHDILL